MAGPEDTRRALLAVLAHPDDESFGMGGTLALYAQRGVDVHLVCATRGEMGVMEEKFVEGFRTSAERREHELRCAAQVLGLKAVHFLDYLDSGMPGSESNHTPGALAAAPLDEVAAKITHHIRAIRPQVVITFDPIGGYRHPDHIAIHHATVRAFEAAANPSIYQDGLPGFQPDKLYFHTIPRGFLRNAIRILPLFGKDPRHWGKNGDINLVELAGDEFPIHAIINCSSVKDLKRQAFECHASQLQFSMGRGLMGWMVRLAANREVYMQAYPKPKPGRRERDLFAGIG
jgi:LmbE family N-acetylglucosaminyl deacetylase